MSKQKTAVDYINNEILIHLNFDQRLYLKEIFKKAKELEKEQIINAYNKGKHISNCGGYDLTAEQYFEETFKN